MKDSEEILEANTDESFMIKAGYVKREEFKVLRYTRPAQAGNEFDRTQLIWNKKTEEAWDGEQWQKIK